MKPSAFGHPFDRVDVTVGVADGKRETRQNWRSIDEHGARPALAKLTAVLGPGEAHLLAQDLQQRLLRRESDLGALAVDYERRVDLLPRDWLDQDWLCWHDGGCSGMRGSRK